MLCVMYAQYHCTPFMMSAIMLNCRYAESQGAFPYTSCSLYFGDLQLSLWPCKENETTNLQPFSQTMVPDI
jgi:hypothetical protein